MYHIQNDVARVWQTVLKSGVQIVDGRKIVFQKWYFYSTFKTIFFHYIFSYVYEFICTLYVNLKIKLLF